MDSPLVAAFAKVTGKGERGQQQTSWVWIPRRMYFKLHGFDRNGKVTLRKRLRRGKLTDFFANVPICVFGLEATQGAHYWARVLETFGHTVRLVAPQLVKPYLQSQTNDGNDAAAILEAVSRPQIRFVPRKTVEQQDLQDLHRIRSQLIGSRTQKR